ncbi:MAG: methionine adenosyltransferase, partial [Clostridia bacterium]|nr:methionine adenosyltransferase [Clostridia bacterium]
MNEKVVLFSSESVTEGHPDKVCDRISDSVLDAIYATDPYARVACEVCATTNLVVVMGEITTESKIDAKQIEQIARDAIKEIGYTDESFGIDYKTCKVIVTLDSQSPDIAMGVNNAVENREGGKDIADVIGAGDQGMMFGYACRETEEYMPLPIMLAHKLTKKLTQMRKSGEMPYLRPDG